MRLAQNDYSRDKFWENCPAGTAQIENTDKGRRTARRVFCATEGVIWEATRECLAFILICSIAKIDAEEPYVRISGSSFVGRRFELFGFLDVFYISG